MPLRPLWPPPVHSVANPFRACSRGMRRRHGIDRCPGGVDRLADGDGAFRAIHLGAIQAECLADRHRLHGEGLVGLRQVGVGDRPGDLLETPAQQSDGSASELPVPGMMQGRPKKELGPVNTMRTPSVGPQIRPNRIFHRPALPFRSCTAGTQRSLRLVLQKMGLCRWVSG